jgi:hypothetical protein
MALDHHADAAVLVQQCSRAMCEEKLAVDQEIMG